MTGLVALLGLLLLLVSFAAFQVYNDRRKKIAVLRWVDEREVYQRRLSSQIAQLRSLGAVPHVGHFDGIWSTGRFGPNGPRTFIPSATGLRQIELAMEILQERENLIQQMRDGVVRTYSAMAQWEQTHPVPDIGLSYEEPPRPVKMPEKNEPKPKAKAFLDQSPDHYKELTR